MKRLTAILSRVLDIDEREITEDLRQASVESWDSFNALVLVSELEAAFSVKFTMDEVKSVECVGDIRRALERHGIQFDHA